MNDLTPVARLSRDLTNASVTLSNSEARYLVDAYYMMQDNRMRSHGQIRAMEVSKEPHAILDWFAAQNENLEQQLKRALDKYSAAHPVGEWLRSIHGVGPVIAAGLLAHIDITRAKTAGAIWRYAGLDPTSKWGKGQKRPWNASLKTLCWKVGESFVKQSNHDRCFYGKIYQQRKEAETAANEAGKFADQAAAILESRKIGKDTDAYAAYSVGKLPKAQIHARARRYAVKLFLSHLHGEMYRRILNQEPPLPYPIAILGHAHMIDPPSDAE